MKALFAALSLFVASSAMAEILTTSRAMDIPAESTSIVLLADALDGSVVSASFCTVNYDKKTWPRTIPEGVDFEIEEKRDGYGRYGDARELTDEEMRAVISRYNSNYGNLNEYNSVGLRRVMSDTGVRVFKGNVIIQQFSLHSSKVRSSLSISCITDLNQSSPSDVSYREGAGMTIEQLLTKLATAASRGYYGQPVPVLVPSSKF